MVVRELGVNWVGQRQWDAAQMGLAGAWQPFSY
jgi:hypothetical protein